MENGDFRTMKGYRLKNNRPVTDAMEDYLEMICRAARKEGYVRINHLAAMLKVKPSSASKMAGNLREAGLVESERYGLIRPTQKGFELGDYLLHRHEVLHRFLCLINHSADETEQVEQVEHFFNAKTIENLEAFLRQYEGMGG